MVTFNPKPLITILKLQVLSIVILTLTGRVNSLTINDEVNSAQIMSTIQVGILRAVENSIHYPGFVTQKDFKVKEVVTMGDSHSYMFPHRQFHKCDFTIYSPRVFDYIRKLNGVNANDFASSMYKLPLQKIQTSIQGGALFYKSGDDKFIVKTVKKKEARFLQEYLHELTKNLKDNPYTMLPKFLGLYGYKRHLTKKMIIVMNNVLPSDVPFYQVFDLKGATHNREASELGKQKKIPTYIDNDFIRIHPAGINVEDKAHTALSQIIKKDCKLLESLHVIDYSLLVGIYNIDHENRRKALKNVENSQDSTPAPNVVSENVIMFTGIIDILTYSGYRKKIDNLLESTIYGNSTTVQSPSSYAERFYNFITKSVFIPTKKV